MKIKILILIGLLSCVLATAHAEELTMMVSYTNPSEIEPKEEDTRFYLPPEIKLKDVIDTAGLDLTYDESRSLYYVHKKQVLQPGETKKYKVVIDNVWVIDEGEIEFLKEQALERVEGMEDADNYEQAKQLSEKLIQELDRIKTEQVSASDKDIKRKIEIFRVNKDRLRTVRNDVLLIEDFKSLVEAEVEVREANKLMTLNIRVKNPSDDKASTRTIKYYLAEGIKAEHVLDKQGFDIFYDPEKRLYYVTRQIDLKAGEIRSFQLQFDDRWRIRDGKLDGYVAEAEDVVIELTDSEFKNRADFLMNEIGKNVGVIKDLQGRQVSIRDKLAFFEDNNKRVDVIKQNILELRRMLEIIRERERQKRLEEILRRVFKEAAWKIIYGTILLLGMISVMTYILWWGQTKKKQVETYEEIEE